MSKHSENQRKNQKTTHHSQQKSQAPNSASLEQPQQFDLQQAEDILYLQSTIGNHAVQDLLQREESKEQAPTYIEMPPMIITGNPNFYPRAERVNKRYPKNPAMSEWPFRDDLRQLWEQSAYDDFADAVRDFQVDSMGLSFDDKAADGILGPNTSRHLVNGATKATTDDRTSEDATSPTQKSSQSEDDISPIAAPITSKKITLSAEANAILEEARTLSKTFTTEKHQSKKIYRNYRKLNKKKKTEEAKQALEEYQQSQSKQMAIQDQLVLAIKTTRAGIANLANPRMRAAAYNELNTYTTFEYQIDNANILYGNSHNAGLRTCNITAVAMVLQGLGKSNQDYKNGSYDTNRLTNIAKAFGGALGVGTETPNLDNLSFPNFLQLVTIDQFLVGDGSDIKAVKKARAKAASKITNSKFLLTVLTEFGTKSERHSHKHSGTLSAFGETSRSAKNRSKKAKDRNMETQQEVAKYYVEVGEIGQGMLPSLSALKELIKGEASQSTLAEQAEVTLKAIQEKAPKSKAKKTGKLCQAILIHAHKTRKFNKKLLLKAVGNLTKYISGWSGVKNAEAFKKAGSYEDMQSLLSVDTYKAGFLPTVSQAMDSGDQVIVNLYNHFVRLESIQEDGFTIDDPGKNAGNSRKIKWEQAIADGYFRKYLIIKP